MIKVVPATIDHIFEFTDNARQIDIEEVEVASGKSFDSHLPSLLLSCIIHQIVMMFVEIKNIRKGASP